MNDRADYQCLVPNVGNRGEYNGYSSCPCLRYDRLSLWYDHGKSDHSDTLSKGIQRQECSTNYQAYNDIQNLIASP